MSLLLFSLPFSLITSIGIGWTMLSIVVSVRSGLEAGARLLLLGLGLLLALTTICALIFYLPDWAGIGILSLGALSFWISTLHYFIASRFAGKLLMALPYNNKAWSMSVMPGVFSILFGLQGFILHNNDFLSPAKLYALGIFMISFGVFRIGERIRYSQVREKGILSETGGFYKWENIENYRWNFGEDKLSLKLRKALFKREVNLRVLSRFRREVVAYLSQNVRIDESNTNGYAPVQKAG